MVDGPNIRVKRTVKPRVLFSSVIQNARSYATPAGAFPIVG